MIVTRLKSFFLLAVIGFSLLSPFLFNPANAAQSTAPSRPEVKVLTLRAQPLQLSLDIVGEVKALREVELRPKVTGTLAAINFQPGQNIKEGDLLFRIDPAPYKVAVASAQAGLAQARATLIQAEQDVRRYKALLPNNAISRQAYDQAVSQAAQASAVVDSRQAALDKANLDLEYTEIQAPLKGRIGLQNVEVGALITAGQTVLVSVSTLDPVAVYFSISENDYLNYAKRHMARQAAGTTEGASRAVDLFLADGTLYEEKGEVDYVAPTVNAASGTLTLRALFPNPANLLRAGMNCRIRIYYRTLDAALLVPQKAVTEMLGKYFLTVVGDQDTIEMRPVKTGVRQGDKWLIEEGLLEGERIVVEGIQKVKAGMRVTPVPAE